MVLILLCVPVLMISVQASNNRPIIGILAQELYLKPHMSATSYIAASYVKAVEQSGARVAPVFINKTEQYYRDMMGSVNGVVIPGGGESFKSIGGYADAARYILNYTKEVNERGDNFPILGICLGLEVLFYLEIESYDILDFCNSDDIPLPLKFKDTYHSSRLYRRAPQNIIDILSDLPVTYNHHKRCVTEKGLKQHGLQKRWHVLSMSVDKDGKEFISSVEYHKQPIAALQFHPEKNAFEWNATTTVPHTHKAVLTAPENMFGLRNILALPQTLGVGRRAAHGMPFGCTPTASKGKSKPTKTEICDEKGGNSKSQAGKKKIQDSRRKPQ